MRTIRKGKVGRQWLRKKVIKIIKRIKQSRLWQNPMIYDTLMPIRFTNKKKSRKPDGYGSRTITLTKLIGEFIITLYRDNVNSF